MRKILVMLLLLLGISFIYNPETETGFVYINSDVANWIILVDSHGNVLRYYKAFIQSEERLDLGFDSWLKDKIQKGMPFKSLIIPYRQQGQKRY